VRFAGAVVLLSGALLSAQAPDDSWLTWSASRAQGIGKAAHVQGRVGGWFDTRILATERSYNYKLAATWLTPDVIRATARTLQLVERLPDDQARALVAEADKAGDTVVMVEIDPREGSGVIPNDWSAFLQAQVPEGETPRTMRGLDTPKLREVKALAGVMRRNYDYDRFWVVFPLTHSDGKPLFGPGDTQAELVVRVAGKEGRVRWPIPQMIKH
jgi:hypothetical protein